MYNPNNNMMHDENAMRSLSNSQLLKANIQPRMDSNLVNKPTVTVTRRAALGDISNKTNTLSNINNNNPNNNDSLLKKKVSDPMLIIQQQQLLLQQQQQQNIQKLQQHQLNSIHEVHKSADMMCDDIIMNDTDIMVKSADVPMSPFDEIDSHNAQLVTEYIYDIMEHLRATEDKRRANANYMSRQTDINAKMREILIDWLIEVHLKFKLRQETLYLTVNIIDRFLERRAVSRNKLQLVGCTAMLIASKYEEIYAPEVHDFVYVTDRAYTREQILAMESIILNALEFNVTVPYSIRFAERFIRIADQPEQFTSLVNFFIELTLQEYKFLKYKPSMIAASAVSLALHLSGNTAWTPQLQAHTLYTEADVRTCVIDLWNLAAKDSPKYRAVRKKYSTKQYHEVGAVVIKPPGIPSSE